MYTDKLASYNNYKRLVDLNKKDDKNLKQYTKDIFDVFEVNALDVIRGFLIERFQRNLRGEKNKKNDYISYLISIDEIAKCIIDQSLLTKLKEHLKKKIEKLQVNIVEATEETIELNDVFKIDITLDPYSNTKKTCFYYFDISDKEIFNGYLNTIFQKYFIPKLEEMYNKSEIKRQIDTDRFSTCTPFDFQEENCLGDPGFKNIRKLIDKFLQSVIEGRKILSDDEIVFINQIKLIQDFAGYYKDLGMAKRIADKEAPLKKEVIEPVTIKKDSLEEENVKALLTKLLKGSVKHKDYTGFFMKEDYCNWAKARHPEISLTKIAEIFDKITTPKPPIGVTRFMVPDSSSKDGKLYYFIALDHIPIVFQELKINDRSFQQVTNIKERHFAIFMKKMFSDFKMANYSDDRISKMLSCSSELVRIMRTTAEKFK